MVVSLLFPFLLFVLVLVLFRFEQMFVPREQEPRADAAARGAAAKGDAPAFADVAESGTRPRKLGERPLLQHLSLWETLDPAIEEEYVHAPRPANNPKVVRPREVLRGVPRVGRQKETVRRTRRSGRRSAGERRVA